METLFMLSLVVYIGLDALVDALGWFLYATYLGIVLALNSPAMYYVKIRTPEYGF